MFPNLIRFSCVIFTVFSFHRRIDLLDFVRSVKTIVLGVFKAENPGWHIRRFQNRRTVYRSDDVKTQLTRIQPRTTVSLSEITLRYFPTNGWFDTKTTVSYNSIYIESLTFCCRQNDILMQFVYRQPKFMWPSREILCSELVHHLHAMLSRFFEGLRAILCIYYSYTISHEVLLQYSRRHDTVLSWNLEKK